MTNLRSFKQKTLIGLCEEAPNILRVPGTLDVTVGIAMYHESGLEQAVPYDGTICGDLVPRFPHSLGSSVPLDHTGTYEVLSY